jgi:hypothetical protein
LGAIAGSPNHGQDAGLEPGHGADPIARRERRKRVADHTGLWDRPLIVHTLTASGIQRFERDGYVVVRQAFSRADSLAMERQWWRELEDTHGIRSDDRSSWRQI